FLVPYASDLATTSVMSSCCSPPVNLCTVRTTSCISASMDKSEQRFKTSSKRSSPNSSPAEFIASVTPSVYKTSVSPGASSVSATSHCQSSNKPTTILVASSRFTHFVSAPLPFWVVSSSGGRWPQFA